MSMAAEQLRTRIKTVLEQDALLVKILPMSGQLDHAKLSRGLLMIKLAESNQINLDLAMNAAVGIELVHMATLIHDDVIDLADLRRGEVSFHKQYGDKGAILFGDYLFSTAMQQIQVTQSEGCAQLFTRCVQDTCRGEAIQDLYLTFAEADISVSLLHEVARGKTGALFSFCTAAPFLMDRDYTGVVRAAVREAGYLSGLAYQLADDILDITGESGNLGKQPGNDLTKNCMTTPLYLLMVELGMNWSTFRKDYIGDLHKLARHFLESKSFAIVQQQVVELKLRMESHLLLIDREKIRFREIIERFWDHYIFKRMSQLRDMAMSYSSLP